ncbi:MAG: hypothetical protein JXB50_06695, partial [Spirochaetes bacterium]|nr:hypothetical protein [Spirochaetota bacterium]
MNILSFIAVVVFLISFFEGAYIFLINKRSVLNILFLFICLSMAIWSLGAAFAYSSDDKSNIIIWEKISSIGFIFLHAFTLHFILEYINFKKVFFKIIIYLPSFLFLIFSFKYPFVFIDYEKIGNYWVCTPNLSSPILLLFMINYLLYYLLCTVFLFFYRKKNINKRIKKQSLIIIFSIIATIFCYNFEPFILSRFLNNRSYALSPIFSIIWISVVWFAFKKYSFLNLDIKGIPLKIVNSLDELIILIDSFLNIKFINERIKNLLEISKSNLKLNDLIL